MATNTLPLFEAAGKFYVYVYRDPRPRKKREPIYVGKGTAKKKRADIHWRRHSHNPILQRILNKIRAAELEPIIEILAWYDDESAAFECEKRLVAQFGRRNQGRGSLCNLTDGGDGASGASRPRPSEETRARLSEAQRANWANPKYRDALLKKLAENYDAERRSQRSAKQKEVMASNPDLVEKFVFSTHTPDALAKRKETLALPEVRAKHSLAIIEAQNRPGIKEKMSETQKIVQNRPEVKAKIAAINATPEMKAKRSAISTLAQSSPEYRQKQREIQLALQNRPETKLRKSKAVRKALSSPESKAAELLPTHYQK